MRMNRSTGGVSVSRERDILRDVQHALQDVDVDGRVTDIRRLPRDTGPSPASEDRGVQIAAAKLRLVTDRRLGKQTPAWIRNLAAETDPSALKTG